MIHIGNKIKAVLKEKGLTVSEFARRINTSRENVYGIFKRQTVDTGLLHKINDVLGHDFFQYYDAKISVANEDAAIYKSSASKSTLFKLIKTLKHELQSCKSAMDLAKQEIDYLKKINHLLEEKLKKA